MYINIVINACSRVSKPLRALLTAYARHYAMVANQYASMLLAPMMWYR